MFRKLKGPATRLKRHVSLSKPVDVALCLDIECTCDSPLQIYPMEIIEIACVRYDLTNSRNESNKPFRQPVKFHSYIKPVINPKLTLFCQELTGIVQSTVDNAPTIETTSQELFKWLQDINMIDSNYDKEENFAFVTCGNFDLHKLSPIIRDVCFERNPDRLPIYFKEWINVKKSFVNHEKIWPRNMYHMLDLLQLEPMGRLHSALDDCVNVARIVECLHNNGVEFTITDREMFEKLPM